MRLDKNNRMDDGRRPLKKAKPTAVGGVDVADRPRRLSEATTSSSSSNGGGGGGNSSIFVCNNYSVNRLALEDSPMTDDAVNGVVTPIDATVPSLSAWRRRWQSKQMAQSIIDNAINNVLGDMGLPRTADSFGAAYVGGAPMIPALWGNFPNVENIENEGVAEAIRQQGLQRRRGPTTTNEMCTMSGSSSSSATMSDESEDLLNTAVSCAISRKGLSLLIVEQRL